MGWGIEWIEWNGAVGKENWENKHHRQEENKLDILFHTNHMSNLPDAASPNAAGARNESKSLGACANNPLGSKVFSGLTIVESNLNEPGRYSVDRSCPDSMEADLGGLFNAT